MIFELYSQNFLLLHFLAALLFAIFWILKVFARGWVPILLDLLGVAALATMLIVAVYYSILVPLFAPEAAEFTMLFLLWQTFGIPVLAGLIVSLLTGRFIGRYLRLIFKRQNA